MTPRSLLSGPWLCSWFWNGHYCPLHFPHAFVKEGDIQTCLNKTLTWVISSEVFIVEHHILYTWSLWQDLSIKGSIFCNINNRTFLLPMWGLWDQSFVLISHRDLELDLWPSLRSNFEIFKFGRIFWIINGRTFIFGTHDPCGKTFLLVPWYDLNLAQGQLCEIWKGSYLIYWQEYCFTCMIFVTSPSHWYHILTFDLVQGQIWKTVNLAVFLKYW